MPSLIGTDIAANYLKNVKSQSGVGKEFIISIARTTANGGVTDAVINDVVAYLTMPHGTGDGVTQSDHAFTVGAIGTADGSALTNTDATELVYMRMQGTGDFTEATAQAGMSGALTNVTVAKVCVFEPAL